LNLFRRIVTDAICGLRGCLSLREPDLRVARAFLAVVS